MQLQAFQPWERRDANDNIIRPGSYGKKSALTNAQNTGILDYIGNNLDVLFAGFNELGVDFDEQGHVIISPAVINKITEAKNEALQEIDTKGSSYQQQITKNANDISTLSGEIAGKVSKAGDTINGELVCKSADFGKSLEVFRSKIGDYDSAIKYSNNSGVLGYIGIKGNNFYPFYFGGNGQQEHLIALADGSNLTTPETTDKSTKIATTYYVKAQDCNVVAQDSSYIRYTSGLQICFGANAASGTVNFPQSFKDTNIAITLGQHAVSGNLFNHIITSLDVSNFTIKSFNKDNNEITVNNSIKWIAIGKWK